MDIILNYILYRWNMHWNHAYPVHFEGNWKIEFEANYSTQKRTEMNFHDFYEIISKDFKILPIQNKML